MTLGVLLIPAVDRLLGVELTPGVECDTDEKVAGKHALLCNSINMLTRPQLDYIKQSVKTTYRKSPRLLVVQLYN